MPSETASPADAGGFEPTLKLHPTSWMFNTLAQLKAALIPLIIAAVLGSRRDASLWLPAIVLVPMVGFALWRQRVYRYGFSPDGLVIHEGLFFRKVRTIDYARIENVDTERGPLHRVLDVADVRVETSTGGDAEARIRVLGLDAVEAMRARIFAQRTEQAPDTAATAETPTAAAAPEETLLSLSPAELVRFGLIDNRGMVLVAAALGVLGQGRFFDNTRGWAGSLFS